MWGGAGHSVAHVITTQAGKTFCMQVTSKKVGDDAKWRAGGSAWAKAHGTTIQDGPCGPTWGDEVMHHDDHHKHIKMSIWSH